MRDKFKQHLKDRFGGKYQVATWETISHEENGEEVIHVGLAKADLTFMEASDLPSEVDGVKVVYSFVGPVEVLTKKYHEPLIGGVSFGAVDITAGTYGGIVYDKDTDEPYLLTNEHVVSNTSNRDPNHPPLEWPILQPGPMDGGRKPPVGYLYRVGGMKRNSMRGETCDIDAALVVGDREVDACRYLGLSHVEELAHVDTRPGDEIIKSGRTTGVTTNTVGAVGVSANIGGMSWANPVVVENVIQTRSAFVEGGDSGSRVWKSATMEPIGIVFAGSRLVSLIIPAQTVCDQLDVYYGKKKLKQGDVNMNTAFYHKKKWWLSAFAVVIPAVNHVFNVGLDPAHLAAILIPIIALIFNESWVEVQELKLQQLKYESKVRQK